MSRRCLSTDARGHSNVLQLITVVWAAVLAGLYMMGYTEIVPVLVIITIAALIISPVKRVEPEGADSE